MENSAGNSRELDGTAAEGALMKQNSIQGEASWAPSEAAENVVEPMQAWPGESYTAPRTPLEVAIAGIWADVLGATRIGIHDDFFRLGGDSLRAVQAIGRIAEGLGLELSLYEAFENRTVAEVAARLSTASRSESAIQRVRRGDPLPMSWAQQRLWFIEQLEGGSKCYYIPVGIRLSGTLSLADLEAALDWLVDRHESLRTVFTRVNGEPVQLIASAGKFQLRQADQTRVEPILRDAEVVRRVRGEMEVTFDLRRGPLIRGLLFQFTQDDHLLLLTMHHIITDGWSIGILIRDLMQSYAAFRGGKRPNLEPLPVQYADYSQWQLRCLSAADLHRQLGYWKRHLQSCPDLLEFPTDRPRPAMRSDRGANEVVSIESDLTASAREFSRRFNVTLAMTLFTAWTIVLNRFSGQEDIVIGVPVANRPRVELAEVVGFFVNTLALRLRVVGGMTVTSLLQRVKEVMLAGYENQDAPFERVVEELRPTRGLSYTPIFQVMFAMQVPMPEVITVPELTVNVQEMPLYTAQYDLLLSLQEMAEKITGSLNYATDLFDEATAARVVKSFKNVLRAMIEQPERQVSLLPVMSVEDCREVIEGFNISPPRCVPEKLIHDIFEEQAERNPHAVAVEYEDKSLTYGQLNARANQLARYLCSHGAGPEQIVGICIDRGLEMVVGLLGILKSGGAYLPLDPTYPRERLAYLLGDANPRILLTQDSLRSSLPPTHAAIVALDKDWNAVARESSSNLDAKTTKLISSQLAYVIYTSGSTGQPKGVMIEHQNVVRLFLGTAHWFGFCAQDVWTLFHSFAFDFSVWELWGALLYGARVVVVPYLTARSSDEFYRLICREGVTVLNQTPSAFLQLIDAQMRKCESSHRLRVVIFGGEALELRMLRPWIERNGTESPQLVNMYGITETTVHVTYRRLDREDIQAEGSSPIGKPIPDLQAYLLDCVGQPVPIGVSGELYIGGAGVARGYLNRPELTAERFLKDPFGLDPLARVYKTGDLGRWRPDGSIQYLGRNDYQVKIRGFRIEIGEIEAQLALHAQVKEVCVLAREDVPGEKRLVAYVVARTSPDGGAALGAEELRAHLTPVLPEYMLPSAFVLLRTLPLTPNGKLDRRALPAPNVGDYANREYEAPRGEMEEILAGIWQRLLRIDRIGRRDNFFELGGHSLLIMQMMELLRRVGLSTEVRRVFESPNLANLAMAVARTDVEQVEAPPNAIPAGCQAITPAMLPLIELNSDQIEWVVKAIPGGAANIQDIYPLTPLQEGILFHHLLNRGSGDTYVVATLLSVDSPKRLEELIGALRTVIGRHDVLRTAVLWQQVPRPVQVVCRHASLPVERLAVDQSQDPLEELRMRMQPERQRLDLGRAPLIRLQVAESGGGGQCFALLQLHHMTCDHETVVAIVTEVTACLNESTAPVAKSLPYRNHVAHILASAKMHDAGAFFSGKLRDVDEPTAPFGLLDVHGDGSQIEESLEHLPAALARRVRFQAKRLNVSVATLYHAAWALVVACTSGRLDVVFGTVLLGRLQGSTGAQRTLGMFINTLPLRLRLKNVTVEELVRQTQRELIELLSHEQSSLAVAQRCSGISGQLPLFSALLNYRYSVSDATSAWSDAKGISVLATQERTNYPIVVSVDDLGEGFAHTVQTDRRISSRRILEYLRTAVGSMVEALELAPEAPVQSLAVLPENERRQVIEIFNATKVSYPEEKLVHELFEDQVKRDPNAVAAVFEGESLTYDRLNRRANQLARYLRKHGVGPEETVGIFVERSLEMVIGLLGILKCGGAYIPLDPSYPPERLCYMVGDSNHRTLLIQESLRLRLPSIATRIVALDKDWAEISQEDESNLDARTLGLHSSHLAYVIYTSGSTGHPKGAMNEHRGVVNRLQWMQEQYKLEPADRVLQKTPFSFDVSVWEFFWTLASGARLIVARPEGHKDPAYIRTLIEHAGVTTVHFVPSMLQVFVDQLEPNACSSLRHVVCSGEELPAMLQRKFFNLLPQVRLSNLYGPTEAAIDVTAWECRQDDTDTPVPIGRPISNLRMYVLDSHWRPVPVGVVGEIYIGGRGVGRGYLNRPDLTADRFIKDPFSADPLERMYKTGDLGCWRADGSLEFLGRTDHQIKIRGFRVELGEIESQLMRYPGVKTAAVLARDDIPGDRRLVAYIVRDADWDDSDVSHDGLRAYLRSLLPEYMIPSGFVFMDSFPLTPNGKLDRRALPVAERGGASGRQHQEPLGHVEVGLATIWKELLRVERVSRTDDFFDCGGHSLLAIQMVVRSNHHFNSTLNVSDMYRNPTLQGLAARIEGRAYTDEFVALSQEAKQGTVIVMPAGTSRVPAKAILLTGGTGFVGRFLLAQLLQDTHATIYCLVRARSEEQAYYRVRSTLLKWKLWSKEFDGRLVVVLGDLTLPMLGLTDETYNSLAHEIDAIYHCATSMNHLETYAAARPTNVEGSRELLRLGTCGKLKVINYISTLSVFSALGCDTDRIVDENHPIDFENHLSSQGYVASKWVGEKIFMMANERGVPCNIFRLGLVWADADLGRYDDLQREYRILKSCFLSGLGIKDYRYRMAPTPVDYVARSIVFLANAHPEGRGIFHISSCGQRIDGVFERCNKIAGTALELVPSYTWMKEIRRLHNAGRSLPVVPLIESAFSLDEKSFRDHEARMEATQVRIECTGTQTELERSGIVAPEVDDELLRKCVRSMFSTDSELRDIAKGDRLVTGWRAGVVAESE